VAKAAPDGYTLLAAGQDGTARCQPSKVAQKSGRYGGRLPSQL